MLIWLKKKRKWKKKQFILKVWKGVGNKGVTGYGASMYDLVRHSVITFKMVGRLSDFIGNGKVSLMFFEGRKWQEKAPFAVANVFLKSQTMSI